MEETAGRIFGNMIHHYGSFLGMCFTFKSAMENIRENLHFAFVDGRESQGASFSSQCFWRDFWGSDVTTLRTSLAGAYRKIQRWQTCSKT